MPANRRQNYFEPAEETETQEKVRSKLVIEELDLSHYDSDQALRHWVDNDWENSDSEGLPRLATSSEANVD